MKKITFQLILTICILSCQILFVKGQPTAINDTENLINGKLWVPKIMNSKGSPLLFNKLQFKGSVLVNSVWFNEVNLAYDLEQDEVISTINTREDTKRVVTFQKGVLHEFTIKTEKQDYNFKRGNLIHPDLKPYSYYQVTSSPNLTYIIHREKFKKINTAIKRHEYILYNRIYIIKDGILTSIKKKRDLIELLNSEQKLIRKYIKSKGLKINPDHPMDAISVIQNFDV